MASSADIRKTSTAPGTTIMKQGHTTNGKFGSNPSVPNKNGPVRDLNPPSTGRR